MITVIGLGVVGLTTALGLSCKGYKVYGYDIDEKKRSLISSGNMDFFEPELPDVLKKNLNRNFVVAGTLSECLSNSKIVFYCVGTPSKDDGSVDLGHLYQAIESTLTHIDKNEYRVLVVKSTVPPSTTKERIKPFIEQP
jgi:UDPglucose 6-dehydrogenase